jgi:hypothetical protein
MTDYEKQYIEESGNKKPYFPDYAEYGLIKFQEDYDDWQKGFIIWLCKRLEKVEKENEWISVEEKLPDFEHAIVLVDATEPSDEKYYDRRVDVAYYNTQNKGWGTFYFHDWAGGKITHWKPFPKIK